MSRATLIVLAAVLLVGCSWSKPRSGNLEATTPHSPNGEPVPIVCPNCGEPSQVLVTGKASDSWRCPKCGLYQPSEVEIRRAPKIKIVSPYSDPPNPWRPVSPVTEQELKKAKSALHLVRANMRVEQVEATLGLSRFASQRLVGSGTISLSIHYDLGNGHSLDMIYNRHFHPPSIDFELSAVVLDSSERWVKKKNETESD